MEAQYREFEAGMIAAGSRPVRIETDVTTCVAIIGQLLLALRHPANKGATAKLARDFAKGLAEALLASEAGFVVPAMMVEEWRRELGVGDGRGE